MKTFLKRFFLRLAHEFGRRPAIKRLTLRALSRWPRLNTIVLSRLARLRAKHVRPLTLDRWGEQIHDRLQFQSRVTDTRKSDKVSA